MKNIALPILAFFVSVGFSYGQVAEQNPNYQSSLDIYTKKLQSSDNTMSTTVQDTYKAVDEWQDKKDRKIENDRLARSYRQERRMARINTPSYYSNPYRYTPNVYGNYSNSNYSLGYGYGQGYGYGNGYGNGSMYGQRNGYCTTSSFYRPYPINYGISGSVRVGRNVWVGF